MNRRKAPFIVVGAGAFIVGSLLAAKPWAPASDVAVAEAGSSYILSDFKVDHPGKAPGSGLSDDSLAAVSFSQAWSGDTYPGVSSCELHLVDAAGQEVGTLDFHAAYAERSGSVPPLLVHVTGSPIDATGACGAATYEKDANYSFELVTVSEYRPADVRSTRLVFTSSWTSPTDPDLRRCTMTVALHDGESITTEFEYGAPDGSNLDQVVPVSPEDVESARVDCQAL